MRRIGTTLCLLLVLIGGWAQEALPGIHDYIFVDVEAKPINMDQVVREMGYPAKAIKSKIEGVVHARVLVDKNGACIAHKITRSVHPLLDAAVSEHIGLLEFRPAELHNKPVYHWVNVPMRFFVAERGTRNIGGLGFSRKLDVFMGRFFGRSTRLIGLSRDAMNAGKFVDAERHLRKLLRLYPGKKRQKGRRESTRIEVLGMWAEVCSAQEKWTSVEQAATEMIASRDENEILSRGQLYLMRGQCRLAQGNSLGGLRDFQWIVRHVESDDRQVALSYAGLIYAGLGAYEQALNHLGEARALNPQDSRCQLYLAEVLGLIGSEEAGKAALDRVMLLGPPDDELSRFQRILSRYNVVSARD